jgi:hypothetical protein
MTNRRAKIMLFGDLRLETLLRSITLSLRRCIFHRMFYSYLMFCIVKNKALDEPLISKSWHLS